MLQVRVVVIDINDNSPMFDVDDVTHAILESTPPGVLFPVQPARDSDSPRFGVSRYELRGGGEKFQLLERWIDENIVDMRLVLNSELDRESIGEYKMELLAFDSGDPANVGSQTITIQVLDANDNMPLFFHQTHELQVEENYPIGLPLRDVTARDLDEGKNGQLFYRFDEKTERLYGKIFKVCSGNGTLLLAQSLDFEQQQLYSLKILVSDSGEFPLTSSAVVVIHVIDVNDNRPKISINDDDVTAGMPSASGDVYVAENRPQNTPVASISVSDADTGAGGAIDCSLTLRTEDRGKFRLEPLMRNEFQIMTSSILDRELKREHDVQVLCTDRGDPRLSAHANLKIVVTDSNDNTPKFTQEHYNFVLRENNDRNAFIGQVKATDADMGAYGRVRYSFCDYISESIQELVNLNARNGVLTAKIEFDHEKRRQVSLCVKAQDSGGSALSSSANVTILIIDVDDNSPKFNKTQFNFDVYENDDSRAVIGRLRAHDLDSPPHDLIYYVIDINSNFDVNANTGTLYTKRSLDRETKDTYEFPVYVRSPKDRVHTDTASVKVKVLDENDNAPVVHSPLPNSILPQISSQTPIGFNITCVNASDVDLAENSRLNFTLSALTLGIFKIDPSTGCIIVARTLNFVKNVEDFTVRLTVTDHGFKRKMTSIFFTIIINASIPFENGSSPSLAVAGSREGIFLNPEIRVIVLASCAALFLVILVICIVCVLFLREKRPKSVRKKDKTAQKSSKNGYVVTNTNGEEPIRTSDTEARYVTQQSLLEVSKQNC